MGAKQLYMSEEQIKKFSNGELKDVHFGFGKDHKCINPKSDSMVKQLNLNGEKVIEETAEQKQDKRLVILENQVQLLNSEINDIKAVVIGNIKETNTVFETYKNKFLELDNRVDSLQIRVANIENDLVEITKIVKSTNELVKSVDQNIESILEQAKGFSAKKCVCEEGIKEETTLIVSKPKKKKSIRMKAVKKKKR